MGLLAGVVSLLAACEEPKDIGLPPTTPVGVLYTDTLTVTSSTIQLDSVVTDRNSRLLVGQYNDPVFGKVRARSFGQLYVNGGSFKTDGEVVFDSLKLLIGYAYLYGDTSKVQELFVHRLTEDLDTTKQYTNTNSALFAAEPLAKLQLTPTAAGGSQTVRLPDALGRELLELSKGSGVTQADFAKVFKGIAILPGAANTTVFGFSNNVFFELFYHKGTETTSTEKDFYTTAGLPSWSQVTSDRTGTKLAGLSLTKPLPTSATGGEAYVQAATGVTTKLTFPTVVNLRREKGRIAINRAELNVQVKGSSPGGPISPLMTMAEVNADNRIQYTYESSTKKRLFHFLQTQIGTFQTVNQWYFPQVTGYSSRLKNYTFDVTTYLQALLVDFRPNTGLVLVPASNSSLVQTATTGLTTYQAQAYMNNQLNGNILNGPMTAKLVVFYTYTP